MQQIQIARGIIEKRGNLLPGEFFLDTTDTSNHQIYVGTTAKGNIKVGGENILSFIDTITDGVLPETPVEGGVYLVVGQSIQDGDDINTSTGVNEYEFKDGDTILFVSELRDPSNGHSGWVKIGGGGNSAFDIEFNRANTEYGESTTTIQKALVEVDRRKLSYGGNLKVPSEYTGESPLTVQDLFGENKVGYYYVNNGTSELKVTINSVEETLEIGDFLAFTSDNVENASPLTAESVKLTKIAGGTHKADKIYIEGLERGDIAAKTIYNETDSNIKDVDTAIKSLYTTKADLDSNGKVLLSELPDTIIGAMDYQGIWTNMGNLPTAADKQNADTDANTDGEYEKGLVKGDYWIYSPAAGTTEWKFTDTEGDFYLIGGHTISSSEGRISSGDMLVFNGESATPQWSVIDNTAPVQGIQVDERIFDGTIQLLTGKRGEENVPETSLEPSAGGGIIIGSPNTVIAKDDWDNSEIPLIDEEKFAKKSGLTIDAENDTFNSKYTKLKVHNTTVQENSETTSEITVTLPKKNGTLVVESDVNSLLTGTENVIPKFRDEGGIEDSCISVDNNSNVTISKGANSVKLSLQELAKNIINILPNFSGYLLNSNSIIDCGEWTDTGVTFTNEGNGAFIEGNNTVIVSHDSSTTYSG